MTLARWRPKWLPKAALTLSLGLCRDMRNTAGRRPRPRRGVGVSGPRRPRGASLRLPEQRLARAASQSWQGAPAGHMAVFCYAAPGCRGAGRCGTGPRHVPGGAAGRDGRAPLSARWRMDSAAIRMRCVACYVLGHALSVFPRHDFEFRNTRTRRHFDLAKQVRLPCVCEDIPVVIEVGRREGHVQLELVSVRIGLRINLPDLVCRSREKINDRQRRAAA